MGKILRLRSTIARPAVATAYAAGDEVSNHATAGSVVRATFNLAGFTDIRLLSCEVDLTAASADVVTTAANFEILLFRTAEAPAAVGDNVTHPITAVQRASSVGDFVFDDTGWTGPLGTIAAGTSQYQAVTAHYVQPTATPVLHFPSDGGYPFSFDGVSAKTLTVVLRATAAWTPGAVINTFGITLNIEAA